MVVTVIYCVLRSQCGCRSGAGIGSEDKLAKRREGRIRCCQSTANSVTLFFFFVKPFAIIFFDADAVL